MSKSVRLTATFKTSMSEDQLADVSKAVALALQGGGVDQARVRTETRHDEWVAAVFEQAEMEEAFADEDYS